jgi:hypothetical protein
MTPAEVLARAAQRGVEVGLTPTGDGLRLWSDGDPPTDLVELLKSAKAELVAHLRARTRDGPLLQSVEAARPPDVADDHWQTAMGGLKAFLAAGHGDEAERLGWPRSELYDLPPTWARVDLCGVGLLIGDATVVEITSTRIGVKTASGAPQGFYQKPAPDYALAYRERIRLAGEDARSESRGEEVRLRALESVVNLYRSHHPGVDIDAAKLAVQAAIRGAEP